MIETYFEYAPTSRFLRSGRTGQHIDAFRADPEAVAQRSSGEGPVGERGDDAVGERMLVDDDRGRVAGEAKVKVRERRVGPVLGRQRPVRLGFVQIEVRVPPCVNVARAAKRLAVLRCGGLPGVVDQDDSGSVPLLQRPEEAKQSADVLGRVLVSEVQADEGVEHDGLRPVALDRRVQTELVARPIQRDVVCVDPADGEPLEVDTTGHAQALVDHAPHDSERKARPCLPFTPVVVDDPASDACLRADAAVGNAGDERITVRPVGRADERASCGEAGSEVRLQCR